MRTDICCSPTLGPILPPDCMTMSRSQEHASFSYPFATTIRSKPKDRPTSTTRSPKQLNMLVRPSPAEVWGEQPIGTNDKASTQNKPHGLLRPPQRQSMRCTRHKALGNQPCQIPHVIAGHQRKPMQFRNAKLVTSLNTITHNGNPRHQPKQYGSPHLPQNESKCSRRSKTRPTVVR